MKYFIFSLIMVMLLFSGCKYQGVIHIETVIITEEEPALEDPVSEELESDLDLITN